jgi:hypothetical protein
MSIVFAASFFGTFVVTKGNPLPRHFIWPALICGHVFATIGFARSTLGPLNNFARWVFLMGMAVVMIIMCLMFSVLVAFLFEHWQLLR